MHAGVDRTGAPQQHFGRDIDDDEWVEILDWMEENDYTTVQGTVLHQLEL